MSTGSLPPRASGATTPPGFGRSREDIRWPSWSPARPWPADPGLSLGSGAPAEVVEELFTVILEDLGPRERAVAEAASVLRRVTLPLLAAIDDEPDVEQSWRTLRGLPFTVTTAAGVELSGLAAPVLLEALELRDPARVRTLRTRAARAILESLAQGPDWESTADLMHLVQNPLIRNAYAPPGMLQHPAEQARSEDHDEIVAIARRFAGRGVRPARRAVVAGAAGHLRRGPRRRRRRRSFLGHRDRRRPGRIRGRGSPPPGRRPTTCATTRCRRAPMPWSSAGRWAAGTASGPRPRWRRWSSTSSAPTCSCARRLRRVYTVVTDWPAAAPVLRVMGFDLLTEVDVGGRRFVLACLDFGPGGVDAWIGRHVLAEQAAPVPARPAAPTRGGRPTARLFSLTAREQEVLALLAEGMTNVQLAEVLFISERTANRHVSNIFTKLGVHNRTQAARAAVAAGLAG